VRRPAAFFHFANEFAKSRHRGKSVAGDCGIDPRQVLEDKPPSAKIGVPDLGIANLAVR
jgi:hypothetical protein